MNKLKFAAKTIALPLFLALTPACASLNHGASVLARHSRILLIEILGGEYEGRQPDWSYIKCALNNASSFMAKANFEARSEQYDPTKEIIVEVASSKKNKITCARAYHEEMGSKL